MLIQFFYYVFGSTVYAQLCSPFPFWLYFVTARSAWSILRMSVIVFRRPWETTKMPTKPFLSPRTQRNKTASRLIPFKCQHWLVGWQREWPLCQPWTLPCRWFIPNPGPAIHKVHKGDGPEHSHQTQTCRVIWVIISDHDGTTSVSKDSVVSKQMKHTDLGHTEVGVWVDPGVCKAAVVVSAWSDTPNFLIWADTYLALTASCHYARGSA